MGVKGLWQVISNSGKPIPLETLEHKVLAIDVSIWLHQAVHGMKGLGGSAIANSHLLVLFHRICKLLFYGIKPVFIFDGGVPRLKKQTLAARRLRREVASKKASKVRERLLANLFKSQAVRKALGKRGPGPAEHRILQVRKTEKDMFELPPLPAESKLEEQALENYGKNDDEGMFTSLHDFDNDNKTFKDLPLQLKHEIMCDLETTRKDNSWNSVNDMPQQSSSFANYQMERLLKRNKFQVDLDSVRQQIQKDHTAELESQLFGDLEEHVSLTHRIISEDAHSIVVKTKKQQEPTTNIFTEQKKVGQSKAQAKSDFLTELSKHGIVDQDNFNDSFGSDDSDEEQVFYRNKSRLEKVSFMKALDCVLDNGTELSQEEIYSMIQQSRQEVGNEFPQQFDADKPSTSKQSEMWQVCSSSDDDDDFIDVPEPNSDADLSPLKSSEGTQSSKSNIDAIRQAKGNSLLLKIMQQKLDDLKPATSGSNRQGATQISEDPGRISISFDADSCQPPIKDIFSDIFYNPTHPPPALASASDVFIDDSSLKQNMKEINKDMSHAIAKNNKELLDSCLVPDNSLLPLAGTDIDDSASLGNANTKCHEHEESEFPSEKSVFIVSSSGDSNSLTSHGSSQKYIQDKSYSQIAVPEVNSGNDYLKSTGYMVTNASNTNTIEHSSPMTKNIRYIYDARTDHNSKVHIVTNDDDSSTKNISTPSQSKVVNNDSNHLTDQFADKSQSDATQGSDYIPVILTPPKPDILTPSKYSEADLLHLEENLVTEQTLLVSQVQTLERVASSISEQKFQEAQELLRLFGIPYLVAPMEAEAQCAFLDSINLTDGTVTDDSDIFLFGGRRVYKNLFNQMKHVEMFDSTNIHRLYGLNRIKMVQFALLSGSDYTVGIESVGAVLAMELLSDFPADDMEGLQKLKKCWASMQRPQLTSSLARQKLSNLHFPETFPSKEVFDAYLKPDVDISDDKFTWGLPNVEALAKFTADKFGWNVSKTSEILVPVLKKIDKKSSQRRLDSYFSHIYLTKEPNVKSKRLLKAIKMSTAEALPDHSEAQQGISKRKTILLPDPPRPKDSEPVKRKQHASKSGMIKRPKPTGSSVKAIVDDNSIVERPLTKEERKQRNFERLLQKPKIPQVEKERLEKALKLQNAVKILNKSKPN